MSKRLDSPDWICTIDNCNKPADYHACTDLTDNKHQYFCDEHWSIFMGYGKKEKDSK